MAILLVLLALGGVVRAGEEDAAEPAALSEAEVRERVPGWLEGLRSSSFATREAAREQLLRHGARAPDLLRAALDDDDAEVRRTVRFVLEGGGMADELPPPERGDLSAIGLLDLEASGPLEAVLAEVGEAVGATFEIPEAVRDTPVALTADEAPFFAALDEVLSQAGLRDVAGFDAAGRMTLEARSITEPLPAAAAGPLRVRVREVSVARALGVAAAPRRVMLEMELTWSPEVQVATYRTPTGLEARTPEGAYEPGTAMRRETTYGVGSTSRLARFPVHLEPAPDTPSAARLDRLAFTLPVRLRHGRRVVRFEALDDLPRTLTLDGEVVAEPRPGTITLHAVARPDGDRGPWVAEIAAWPRSEAHRASLVAALRRPDGTWQAAHAGARATRADGRVDLTARAWGSWEEGPPTAVRVGWFEHEDEGSLRFELEDVPLR